MTKQRRSFEGSSVCSAPASKVWAVWTDPAQWPGGIIERASVDGDFTDGAKLTVKAKGGPKTTATVTSIDPPRMWVGVSRFPGLKLTSEHVIAVADNGTVLTERVHMSGPLAAVAARFIGNRLETDFVATTARIAQVAQDQAK